VPTDNVGVTTYHVFRSGVTNPFGVTTNSFTDIGLAQGTTYTYTIKALDAAGNISAASAPFSVTTKSKAGDINGDNAVNILDLSILASHFGQSGQTLSTGDLNGDGSVNIFDLSVLASKWGT
jgi:hypothetical protein